jgi:hypothetical protein
MLFRTLIQDTPRASRPGGVPREQWRNYQKWVRFYLHFCHKYCHRPADSKSLKLFIGKLASEGQTAEQRAQAQCAVAYYAVFLSPQFRSLRDNDAIAPAAAQDGEDGLPARKQESVIGQCRMMEEPAQVFVAVLRFVGPTNKRFCGWKSISPVRLTIPLYRNPAASSTSP